jgi:hypothetical protein
MPLFLYSCGGDDDNNNSSEKKEQESKTPDKPSNDPNLLVVELQMAGTLSSNIPNQKFTKLKIKGKINGSDIKYIRGIISNLSELDLSESSIVEGGDSYYKISYKTTNNVIGECMFADLNGNFNLILPKNIIKIDNYAFENCKGLQTIVMYNNIQSISDYCFIDCTNLTKVTLTNILTNLSKGVFKNCSSLENIELPSSLYDIGKESFYGCSKLQTISLPSRLNIIGQSAFKDCKTLQSIEIPDGVYSIGASAFENCSSLSVVNIKAPIKRIENSMFAYTKLKSFTIPETVEEIGMNSFYGCKELKEINIGKNVKSISTDCAQKCTVFSKYNVSEDNQIYSSIDGVLFSKDKVTLLSYPHGKEDISYTIPESVKTIAGDAFATTNNLKSVTFSSGLETVEARAFLNHPMFNEKLEEIHMVSETPPFVKESYGHYGFPKDDYGKIDALFIPSKYKDKYNYNTWKKFFKNIYEE